MADDEFTPIRPGAELPEAALASYLVDLLPGASGPMQVRQFRGGNANLTYMIAFGDRQYVLRRPPPGHRAAGAHDMAREYRVMAALADSYPLVPRPYALVEDDGVLGFPFMVMERRVGDVIRADFPASIDPTPDVCARIGRMVPQTLAALHRLSPDAVGLGDLGKPEGYLERQVTGWARRYAALAVPTDDVSLSVAATLAWIERHMPTTGDTTLLHNDFKLDNILLSLADPAVPVAVLDWDMCTRGDPLTELGYLLNYWAEPGDDPRFIAAASMPTWRSGFPSRREMVALYAENSDRALGHIHWYYVLGIFKLLVILQQIYTRYRNGEYVDDRFRLFGLRIEGLAAKAAFAIDRGTI